LVKERLLSASDEIHISIKSDTRRILANDKIRFVAQMDYSPAGEQRSKTDS
jgi:hypothetical protein